MVEGKNLIVAPGQQLPNLHTEAEDSLLDLASSYWTPKEPGESKLVFFMKVDEAMVPDPNDPESRRPLQCAFFLEQTDKGHTFQVHNGSKMLVGTITEHKIAPGTALRITYVGEKPNKNNGFKHDSWSVRPLQPKAA